MIYNYVCFFVTVKRYVNKLNSTAPVSYTHLDVYKRQIILQAVLILLHIHRISSIASARSRSSADGVDYPESSRAVSYTHLDVYKRQLVSW